MPLDKKVPIKHGRNGGLASVIERRKETVPRNKALVLAYKYLTPGMYLSPKDKERAIEFLMNNGLGPYHPPEKVSVLVYLATAVNLSKDHLQRILKKALK